ncbi:VOC family protein [Gellertiella hungarica]|uniref:Catechol 2,3-dioxygenase-like lactoylglutathione lyase family enzyme n=1 Tax=Gellertiella hungarica TaxID=1572859 RepID=A0A7W6J6T3_9HYPH|nr:VOC family protein [Gellertiella hungarica]MBB4065042.1 catechol 2,3-dioxygenase-like lactoylglutathione lyase family enzyme [Gellertiella hungarica]
MGLYATLGVNDLTRSTLFYDAVLATIGWASHTEFPGWRAYSRGGSGEGFTLWICEPFNGEPATAGNGAMLGFDAATYAEVEAFYAAAMTHGGTDEGAPGPRPQYGPNWMSAYVRDPAGNKLAIVYNG